MPAHVRQLVIFYCGILASISAIAQQAKNSPANIKPPVFVTGLRIDGIADKETIVEGDAVLRRGDQMISGDWLRFENESEIVEGKGNVTVQREGTLMKGPYLHLRTSDSIGTMQSPSYVFKPHPRPNTPQQTGRGVASSIEFEGEDKYRLVNATFTTCVPGDNSWYMDVEELSLDYGREVGSAKWATLHFFDQSIAKIPFLDFSLNNQRKSGFLAPSFASTGRSEIGRAHV